MPTLIQSGIKEEDLPQLLESGVNLDNQLEQQTEPTQNVTNQSNDIKPEGAMNFLKKTIHATAEVLDNAVGKIDETFLGKPYEMKIDQSSGPEQVFGEIAKRTAHDAFRIAPFLLGGGPVRLGLTVGGSELGKKAVETGGFKEGDSPFISSLASASLQGIFAGTLGKLADFATKKYFSRNAAQAARTASTEARTQIEGAMKELSDLAHHGKQSALSEEARGINAQRQFDSEITGIQRTVQEKKAKFDQMIENTRAEIKTSESDFTAREQSLTDSLTKQLNENKNVSEQTRAKAEALFQKNLNRTSRVNQKALDNSRKIISQSFEDVLKNPDISQTLVKPEGIFENLSANTPFYAPGDVMANMGLKGAEAKEVGGVLDNVYKGKEITFSQAHNLKIKLNDTGNSLLQDPSTKTLAHDYFNAADAIDNALEAVPGSGYKLINSNYRKLSQAERIQSEYFGKTSEYGSLKVRPDFKTEMKKKLEAGIPINQSDLQKNIDDNLALHAVIDLSESIGQARRAASLRGHLNALESSYKNLQSAETMLADLNKIKINDHPLLVELNADKSKLLSDFKSNMARLRYARAQASNEAGYFTKSLEAQKTETLRQQRLQNINNESAVLEKKKQLEDIISSKGAMLRGSDKERVTSTLRNLTDVVSLAIPDPSIRYGLKGLVTLHSMIGENSSEESKVILSEGIKAYQAMLEKYNAKFPPGSKPFGNKPIPENVNRTIALILSNLTSNTLKSALGGDPNAP